MGVRANVLDLRSAMRRRAMLPIITMPPVQAAGLLSAAIWSTALPAVGSDIPLKNTVTFSAGHTGTNIVLPWGWALYFTKTNTAADSTATLRVSGYDVDDNPISEVVSILAASTTIQTTKCYKEITGITVLAKANGTDNDTLAIGWVGNVGSNVTMKVATPFLMSKLTDLRYIVASQGGIVAGCFMMVPNALDVSLQTVNFVSNPSGIAFTTTQPVQYACHALRSSNGIGHPKL